MTSSKRLKELDGAADRIVEELEALQKGIPFFIFLIRLAQIQVRREIREAGETELALLGQRQEEAMRGHVLRDGDRVNIRFRREEEAGS